MSEQKLQVAICTCGADGLERVAKMTLPQVDGVGYMVSSQSPVRALPEALCRDDVKVTFTDSLGLSNNRNHALSQVTAPLVILGDDDLNYNAEGIKGIIDAFDANPDVDIITFRCEFQTSRCYPDAKTPLDQPVKGYEPCSVEIAARLASLREYHLAFDPSLGLGSARYLCAEEAVFLLNAKRARLKGLFVPITVCEHPEESTGYKLPMPAGVIEAQGLYMGLMFGPTLLPRIVLKAWRTPGPRMRSLRLLAQGALYGLLHRGRFLRQMPVARE